MVNHDLSFFPSLHSSSPHFTVIEDGALIVTSIFTIPRKGLGLAVSPLTQSKEQMQPYFTHCMDNCNGKQNIIGIVPPQTTGVDGVSVD